MKAVEINCAIQVPSRGIASHSADSKLQTFVKLIKEINEEASERWVAMET